MDTDTLLAPLVDKIGGIVDQYVKKIDDIHASGKEAAIKKHLDNLPRARQLPPEKIAKVVPLPPPERFKDLPSAVAVPPQPQQPSRPKTTSLPWFKHGVRGFLRKLWHGDSPDNPDWQHESTRLSLESYINIRNQTYNFFSNCLTEEDLSGMGGMPDVQNLMAQMKQDIVAAITHDFNELRKTMRKRGPNKKNDGPSSEVIDPVGGESSPSSVSGDVTPSDTVVGSEDGNKDNIEVASKKTKESQEPKTFVGLYKNFIVGMPPTSFMNRLQRDTGIKSDGDGSTTTENIEKLIELFKYENGKPGKMGRASRDLCKWDDIKSYEELADRLKWGGKTKEDFLKIVDSKLKSITQEEDERMNTNVNHDALGSINDDEPF